jgi:hypothetical protein
MHRGTHQIALEHVLALLGKVHWSHQVDRVGHTGMPWALQVNLSPYVFVPVVQLKQRCEDLSHKARHLHAAVSQGLGGPGALAYSTLQQQCNTLLHSNSILMCSLCSPVAVCSLQTLWHAMSVRLY